MATVWGEAAHNFECKPMSSSNWPTEDFQKIDALGRARVAQGFLRRGVWLEAEGRRLINFASNDYLQLAEHPNVISATQLAMDEFGLGTGASRLLSGTNPLHNELERRLAAFLSQESAALFSSGYLANIGFLSSALSRHDAVVSDKLVHASILDGIRLSGANSFRFQHNDLEDAERMLRAAREKVGFQGRVLLVSESVFSMDGDTAPVDALCKLAAQVEAATYFDEAHAVGLFGAQGRGVALHSNSDFVGITLSKSFGGVGGCIAGNAALRAWLHSSARSFIFNTSLPAALCAGAIAALELIESGLVDGAAVLESAERFRSKLRSAGLNCLNSESQIVPVLINDQTKAVEMARKLAVRGLFIPAIRSPTVLPGTERLRISITAGMDEELLDGAAKDILEVAKELGVLS